MALGALREIFEKKVGVGVLLLLANQAGNGVCVQEATCSLRVTRTRSHRVLRARGAGQDPLRQTQQAPCLSQHPVMETSDQ